MMKLLTIYLFGITAAFANKAGKSVMCKFIIYKQSKAKNYLYFKFFK